LIKIIVSNDVRLGILCQHRSGHTAFEQHLSATHGTALLQELDLNLQHAEVEEYLQNLPKNCILSMMPRENSGELMEKYNNIDWKILLRKDVRKQCLSFVYTNKTQVFTNKQEKIVDVDVDLIDYFFINYKIIQEIVRKNKYEIFYYEELDLGNAYHTLTNNNYEELIANIELVNARIGKYLG